MESIIKKLNVSEDIKQDSIEKLKSTNILEIKKMIKLFGEEKSLKMIIENFHINEYLSFLLIEEIMKEEKETKEKLIQMEKEKLIQMTQMTQMTQKTQKKKRFGCLSKRLLFLLDIKKKILLAT